MSYCLIADDNSDMRTTLRGMLTDLGFEVEEAATGIEALRSCQSRLPDAMLLDWNMPQMDGMEVLHALSETSAGPWPKIIFCITGAESAAIIRAISAGASEYLVKPFDTKLLSQKLELLGVAQGKS